LARAVRHEPGHGPVEIAGHLLRAWLDCKGSAWQRAGPSFPTTRRSQPAYPGPTWAVTTT
jgi:hypothetical protein